MPNESVDPSLQMDAQQSAELDAIFQEGQTKAARKNPVGTFQFDIQDATFEQSKNSGRWQIHYELQILTGEYAGEVLNKYDGFGSGDQAQISLSQLKVLGVDTTRLTHAQLPAVLLKVKGKQVVGRAKQNGEFYNINFQKLITAPLARPAPAAAAQQTKPF